MQKHTHTRTYAQIKQNRRTNGQDNDGKINTSDSELLSKRELDFRARKKRGKDEKTDNSILTGEDSYLMLKARRRPTLLIASAFVYTHSCST